MQLSHLTDDELVRLAHTEIDSLTSTPLELELLRRFETLIDSHSGTFSKLAEHGYADSDAADVLDAVNQHELDADGIRKLGEALVLNAGNTAELLQALTKAGYDNAAALEADLELAERFAVLAVDAGDVFARLSTLTETATE